MTQAPSRQERRANPRFSPSPSGTNPLVATVGLDPRAALVLDLSRNGIGLLTTAPPPDGSVVPVWLPRRHEPTSALLLVCVIHSFRQPDELFRVGGELVDEDSRRAALDFLPAPPSLN
jgi:hypothetical protein